MSPHSCHRVTTLLILGASLWGCSILAPQKDVSRFYTLDPVAEAHSDGDTAPRGIIYGLGPIEMPEYLDRDELALRVSPAEVTYSPTDFWAEPLQTNLTRILLQDLSALLGADRIVLYPWPRTVSVSYQVAINVLKFERTATGEALLHARWNIQDPRTGTYLTLKESRFTHSAASPATADGVNAMSADVGDLSRDIAAALLRLPVPPPPGSPVQKGP
jgi:uncharacterized lipoprotein YmbA